MTDAKRILEAATNILLVDWPHQGVPRALIEAGFTVFAYSPDRYSTAEIVEQVSDDATEQNVFAPESDDVVGFLVFRPFEGRPDSIDIVCVYRPLEEISSIVERQVLPLGAQVLWLQPPLTSAEAHELAAEHGLVVVEGADIAVVARGLIV